MQIPLDRAGKTCDGWIGRTDRGSYGTRPDDRRQTRAACGLGTPRGRGIVAEVDRDMLHFTCDLCGKELLPGDDRRYVVRVEVYAAHDPAELTEADLDQDHMDEVSQILEEMEEDGADPDQSAPAFKKFRYDLCPDCHKKFLRDPLNKEAAQKFHFSEN